MVSTPVETLPDVAFPVEKPPADTHFVALVELQVSVEDVPLSIVSGVAVKIAVGAGIITVTVFVSEAGPLSPVQLIV